MTNKDETDIWKLKNLYDALQDFYIKNSYTEQFESIKKDIKKLEKRIDSHHNNNSTKIFVGVPNE